MSQTVLIKLTPLDTFFFGGETTLGEGEGRNYFAHSNYFPQQTTLLGMLRQQILIQNDNKKEGINIYPITTDNSKKASDWVGETSFNLEEHEQTFGKILKLSPVFMMKGGDKYFLRSKEFIEKTHLVFSKETIKASWSFNDMKKSFIPLLKKASDKGAYNPKEDFLEQLVCKNAVPLNYDKKVKTGVFAPASKVGITKNYDGAPNDDAFFKQTFWRLAPNWAFAFMAELNEDVVLNSDTVHMGAEKRQFKMNVEKIKSNITVQQLSTEYLDDETPQYDDLQKMILLSDAIVTEDIYNKADFSIASAVSFRNIKTHFGVKEWFALSTDDKQKPIKSNKYQLLARGSVFFGDDLKVLQTALNIPAYQNIGFNYYTIVDKKTSL
jgi:CRISPR-associated protein Cmr3